MLITSRACSGLTIYRLPDSGNNMQQIWTAPLPKETTFQTNPVYRLPLWELVYHDCVVAHWYWGDYDNKIPALWDRRDLFNMLYGTVPMFMFDRAFWNAHKDRFVQSYRNTCPLAPRCRLQRDARPPVAYARRARAAIALRQRRHGHGQFRRATLTRSIRTT